MIFNISMFALVSIIGYLLGSLNFSIILSKLVYKKDIRDYGSKNAGMTNTLRTFNKKIALLTLIGDFSKGIIAILIGRFIISTALSVDMIYISDILVAFFALLGHVFPIYYNFKGGKGVLVSAGCILMIDWVVFLIIFGVFLIFFSLSRIISLGSILSSASFPITIFIKMLITKTQTIHIIIVTILAFLMSSLIIYLHRGNIKRLLNHEEPKIGK